MPALAPQDLNQPFKGNTGSNEGRHLFTTLPMDRVDRRILLKVSLAKGGGKVTLDCNLQDVRWAGEVIHCNADLLACKQDVFPGGLRVACCRDMRSSD